MAKPPLKHSSWVVVAHGRGKDKKYLVGKRGKKANNAGQWGFFGGTNDPGEHPKESALREFHEEAGHKIDRAAYMGTHKTKPKHSHYFFHRSDEQFKPKTNYETAKTAWVSAKKLKKMNLHASVKDYFEKVKPKRLAGQLVKKAAQKGMETKASNQSYGHWIDHTGKTHDVNEDQGHDKIALRHIQNNEHLDEQYENFPKSHHNHPASAFLMNHHGWVRTVNEKAHLGLQFRGNSLSKSTAKTLLKHISENNHHSYFVDINDKDHPSSVKSNVLRGDKSKEQVKKLIHENVNRGHETKASFDNVSFWVDPYGETHHVESHGHEEFANQHIKDNKLGKNFKNWSKSISHKYDQNTPVGYLVHQHKWVRGVHASDDNSLIITKPKSITPKTAQTLHKLASHNYSQYHVNTINPPDFDHYHNFNGPSGKREFNQHIRKHTESNRVTAGLDDAHYGHWITPEGHVHDVPHGKDHESQVHHNMSQEQKNDLKAFSEKHKRNVSATIWAVHRLGWARVVKENNSVGFNFKKDSLTKPQARHILNHLAKHDYIGHGLEIEGHGDLKGEHHFNEDYKARTKTQKIIRENINHGHKVTASGEHHLDKVPMELGKTPIPEGRMRRFHVTHPDNIEDIKHNGISMKNAKGIEGPKGVYSWSNKKDAEHYGNHIIEFHDDPKHYEAHPYASSHSVPAHNIVAIHKPWHEPYRLVKGDHEMENRLLKNKDYSEPYKRAAEQIEKEGLTPHKTTASIAAPEIGGTHHGITYDQKNGLGNVPDNQSVNYKGFSVYMKPSQFLKLTPKRTFDKDSSIKHIETAVRTNKPIASPFLDVSFDRKHKKPAIVNGHEGRTRMEAIHRVHGDVPVLVHVFAGNGMRARHISNAHIKAFQEAAVPEKKVRAIKGKHFDDNIHVRDQWHDINELPPFQVKSAVNDNLNQSNRTKDVIMAARNKPVLAAKTELGIHHVNIKPTTTFGQKFGKLAHEVHLVGSNRRIGTLHPDLASKGEKWISHHGNKSTVYNSLEEGALHILKRSKPLKYELTASTRDLETTAIFGAIKRGIQKLNNHITGGYHRDEAQRWNNVAAKHQVGSEDHAIATNAANRHRNLANHYHNKIFEANNRVKGAKVPSTIDVHNHVNKTFSNKTTAEKNQIAQHTRALFQHHSLNKHNINDHMIHYHNNALKKLTGSSLNHPAWAPKLKAADPHKNISAPGAQPHKNEPKTVAQATENLAKVKQKTDKFAKGKNTVKAPIPSRLNEINHFDKRKAKSKAAKPAKSAQDIANEERAQRLLKKHNVSPEDAKHINGEPSTKDEAPASTKTVTKPLSKDMQKAHDYISKNHPNLTGKDKEHAARMHSNLNHMYSSLKASGHKNADADKVVNSVHTRYRELTGRNHPAFNHYDRLKPDEKGNGALIKSKTSHINENENHLSKTAPAKPKAVKTPKPANTNKIPEAAKQHHDAIKSYTKLKNKHTKILNGVKDALKNGDLDKTARAKLKQKHTEHFNTLKTVNRGIKEHTAKLHAMGVAPPKSKTKPVTPKAVTASVNIVQPKRSVLRSF